MGGVGGEVSAPKAEADRQALEPGLISICIPARNRPKELCEAVESCFAQAYRPLEILIGDDSDDASSETAVAALRPPEGIALDYRRNPAPLGQAGNVNSLFDRARGARLVLLHDDDLLVAGGLDALVEAWADAEAKGHAVAAAFGKQYLIGPDGEILPERSEELNRAFHRTADRAGIQVSAFVSGLERQFPNDGYLVATALAKRVNYRPEREVGRYVDMDFGIRLGRFAETADEAVFVFHDGYTAQYRLSDVAVSKASPEEWGDHLFFEAIATLEPPPEYADHHRNVVSDLATRAVPTFALAGQRKKALRTFLSSEYGRRRLSAKGVYHLAIILLPSFFLLREKYRGLSA